MASSKVGEKSRDEVVFHIVESLKSFGYDVLQVGSASYAVPVVEDGEESAVRIVVQIPKGTRTGEGYDPYEEAQDYSFKQEEARKKREKKAEEKARKIAKAKKEKGE